MKIGIKATMFQIEKKTGIPISVENVLRSWSKNHPENEYYLFARKKIFLDIDWGENWHIIHSPYKNDAKLSPRFKPISKVYGLLYKLFAPRCQLKKLGIDVYWGTNYMLPRRKRGVKYAVSVYDLALFRFKNISTTANSIIHQIWLPLSAKRADKIITISKSSAKDIHEILKADEDKIFISYQGGLYGKEKALKTVDESVIRPELRFDGKFVLFISTIEPRKNIPTLIKAFEKYVETYSDSRLHLVLAGGRGWKCDNVYNAMETSKYRSQIIMPGYISNEERNYLLEHAEVFAYPSLYEGFGLPILEAFDRDLPVITSNVSSMPEVGGDAAFYVNDPYDPDELAAQLRRVLTLSDEEKAELKIKMRDQLNKFSWDKNAEEIMTMLKQLCGEDNGGR